MSNFKCKEPSLELLLHEAMREYPYWIASSVVALARVPIVISFKSSIMRRACTDGESLENLGDMLQRSASIQTEHDTHNEEDDISPLSLH
jgi:hypothetical protein